MPVTLAEDGHKPFQRLTLAGMSVHSYSRCWVHLIWATLNREKLLHNKAARVAETNGIYMKINYVNADHVYVFVDLPTGQSVEKVVQLIKGSSSHWINTNNVIAQKFAWGRGYGVFSVSESNVGQGAAYITGQEQHHHMRTFAEEFKEFVNRHGLHWKDEGSR
jgi:putative transposase